MRIPIVICGTLLGLLLAAIVAASLHSSVIEGLLRIVADPWGLVTLLDLGIGLLFIAVWLTLMEPRPRYAALWIIALFLLGNVVTLGFLLCRTRHAKTLRDLFLPTQTRSEPSPTP